MAYLKGHSKIIINQPPKDMTMSTTFLATHLLRSHSIKRWPLMFSVREETLAGHLADTCMLGHLLAAVAVNICGRQDIDPDKVASYCLFHEISESLLGDINSKAKHINQETHQAIKTVENHFEALSIEMLPDALKARYTPLISQDKNEINAKVAKISDSFAALIKCQWEISRGNKVEFLEARDSIQEQIDIYTEKYDFVRKFIELFLNEDITRISVDKLMPRDWVKNTDAGKMRD